MPEIKKDPNVYLESEMIYTDEEGKEISLFEQIPDVEEDLITPSEQAQYFGLINYFRNIGLGDVVDSVFNKYLNIDDDLKYEKRRIDKWFNKSIQDLKSSFDSGEISKERYDSIYEKIKNEYDKKISDLKANFYTRITRQDFLISVQEFNRGLKKYIDKIFDSFISDVYTYNILNDKEKNKLEILVNNFKNAFCDFFSHYAALVILKRGKGLLPSEKNVLMSLRNSLKNYTNELINFIAGNIFLVTLFQNRILENKLFSELIHIPLKEYLNIEEIKNLNLDFLPIISAKKIKSFDLRNKILVEQFKKFAFGVYDDIKFKKYVNNIFNKVASWKEDDLAIINYKFNDLLRKSNSLEDIIYRNILIELINKFTKNNGSY